MNLVKDYLENSSSIDECTTFLDTYLASDAANSSSDEEVDLEKDRIKRCKFETLEISEEPKASTSKGYVEKGLKASVKLDICRHPVSFGDICVVCGQRVTDKFGVTLDYIHKGLRLATDEIVRLRKSNVNNLLSEKKLYLILDLDHTLLNSTRFSEMTLEEHYLKSQAKSSQGSFKGNLFRLKHMRRMIKLRPFIHTFLEEASAMFEMYIYTLASKQYALEMAKLLDPDGKYFQARVISGDDSTEKDRKCLDVFLGQESAVLILDDTKKVWEKHEENLILMERYHYFDSSCRKFGFAYGSHCQLKRDESKSKGALATVLKVLQQIHTIFFNELKEDLADRDVRQVLKAVQGKVLRDCTIVFSGVFQIGFPAENHPLWKMAEQLGATCSVDIDSNATHVVATELEAEKSRLAVKEGKFLVNPQWIEHSFYLWQKQPEERFPVSSAKIQFDVDCVDKI